MIINHTEIEDIIKQTFGKRFTRDFSLQISDEQYYCPSLEDVTLLIEKNTSDKMEYIGDVFDCDDYALVLKAFFIKQAYKDKHRRYPYCMGMIMGGKLQGNIPHAINFVITDKLEFYLIEPQQDEILKPTKLDREIYFMFILVGLFYEKCF